MSIYSEEKSARLRKAIFYENHAEIKSLLMDPEVDLEARFRGYTPFCLVCNWSDPSIVRMFLDCERHIDYNAKTTCRESLTAIEISAEDLQMFEMLVNDPRIDVNVGSKGRALLRHIGRYYHVLQKTKILLACERFDPHFTAEDCTIETVYQLSVNGPFHSVPAYREGVDLIKAYVQDPAAVREQLRRELGCPEYRAAELFATVVLACDGYYEIKD